MEKKKYKSKYGLTENLEEAEISLCRLIGGCKCMTYSIESEDKTHFYCGKCKNTK